jgi:DNA-binding XRE family transcriptional regulator
VPGTDNAENREAPLLAVRAVPLKRKIAAQLKAFGANVRRERVAAALTQERLAEKADLNIRTLQSVEAGQLNVLVTTAMRLQRAMDCDWRDLMGR